jgi:small subunit ribosomal protein S6
MKQYEGIFVFPPVLTAEEKKRSEEKLEEVIARQGGKVIAKQDWGKRLLGYTVQRYRDGYFLLMDIAMDPAKVAEFRGVIELMPEVIKHTFMCKEIKKVKPEPRKAKAAAAQPAAAPAAPAKAEGV